MRLPTAESHGNHFLTPRASAHEVRNAPDPTDAPAQGCTRDWWPVDLFAPLSMRRTRRMKTE
jgi:hypothetical protein